MSARRSDTTDDARPADPGLGLPAVDVEVPVDAEPAPPPEPTVEQDPGAQEVS